MPERGPGRLAGNVALVTGGASGIGRASAILFAHEGARIVVADLPGSPIDDTLSAIREAGGQAVAAAGDVRRAEDAERMVATAVAQFGRIDVLFNNAGIEFVASVEDMPEDKWDLVVDTNLKGIYLMSKAAIPRMIQQGGGKIINTASQLGWVGAPRFSAYCASKGGVLNLTRAMALELAPHNIRVNALCPGAVETPLLLRQFGGGRSGPQGTLQMLADLHALKRIAQPVELAYPALFLACDESSFMTGASLVVDGGYIAS
jgi:NAD(P)-dependent dehydrogenase (short-subunit alcohol dehydrogenase family)